MSNARFHTLSARALRKKMNEIYDTRKKHRVAAKFDGWKQERKGERNRQAQKQHTTRRSAKNVATPFKSSAAVGTQAKNRKQSYDPHGASQVKTVSSLYLSSTPSSSSLQTQSRTTNDNYTMRTRSARFRTISTLHSSIISPSSRRRTRRSKPGLRVSQNAGVFLRGDST